MDLTGQTFGQLTVLKQAGYKVQSSGFRRLQYECKCSCGNIVTVNGNDLRTGGTRSCGCIRRNNAKKQGTALANTKANRYEFDGDVGKCYFNNTDGYFYSILRIMIR